MMRKTSKHDMDPEMDKRYVKSLRIMGSVKKQLQCRSDDEFRSILSSAIGRELSEQDFTELGLTADKGSEELVETLAYALIFEVYFSGDSNAVIPVPLLKSA